MTRPFTGWHMLAILVAMFGVIVAVNFTMASFAVSTFGGTVVDNSYVASQRFNHWLAEAEAQRELGWTVDARLDSSRVVRIDARSAAGSVAGARVSAVAIHPLGRAPERRIAFFGVGDGRYVAREALPPGRWLLRIEVHQGTRAARFIDDVPA